MNLKHSRSEVTHEALEKFPFLLLDGKEEVRVLLGPSATLKLDNELLAKLLKGVNGVR